MFTQRLRRLSRSFQVGVSCAFIASGMNRSGERVAVTPAKPAGATPTIVIGVLLMVTTWLSTAAEPLKRRCQ